MDVTLVGRMLTYALNGTTVIANREIPGITGGALDSAEGEPGPLLLQGDHGPVEYRNIVITPAEDRAIAGASSTSEPEEVIMRTILAVAVLVPLVAGCVMDAAPQMSGAAQQSANLPFQVQVVADFESPWAMTFLPDGRMLITEKAGTLYLVSADGQQRTRVDGIPAVASEGQGGFMDVVLHPGFATNRLVYFSYAEAGQGGKGVVLARGAFVDGEQPALQKVETLFRAVALRGRRRPLLGPHRVLEGRLPLLHQRRTSEVRAGAGSEGDAGEGAAPQ